MRGKHGADHYLAVLSRRRAPHRAGHECKASILPRVAFVYAEPAGTGRPGPGSCRRRLTQLTSRPHWRASSWRSPPSAADVARAAADLILLEHDLSVVREAVVAGRSTVQNVSKYVLMGASSNFGNMFSMAGAALILPFLPMLPIQILLNNLIYNVSEIAIPFDRVDPEAVVGPVKWDLRLVERFMLIFGPVSSIFDFLTFYALLSLFGAGEALFQTGWFIESMTTQTLVVFCIRTRRRFYRSRPCGFLVGMNLAAVAVAILLPLLPWGGWFGFVPPPPMFFVFLICATLAYLGLVEIAKVFFYRAIARR